MTVLPAAMVLALLIDRWWGEPPVRWHPVVWMGQGLDAMGRRIAPGMGAPAPAAARLFATGGRGIFLNNRLLDDVRSAGDVDVAVPGGLGGPARPDRAIWRPGGCG